MLDERVKRKAADRDYLKLSDIQLELANATIHTTSMALLEKLFDLVAMPEYQDLIREEVAEASEKSGGKWDGTFLKGLQKTDSFMKESQRWEPVGLDSAKSANQSPSPTASTCPPTLTIANALGINQDPNIVHADTDLRKFDGLRYFNMRERMAREDVAMTEVAGKHQFVSVSTGSLMFGYGRRACPGRFFAGNEIKLILVKLLLQFDIKSNAPVRPRSTSWEFTNTPDTSRLLLLKRRQKA